MTTDLEGTGEELFRIDLGDGFVLIVEDDGDNDPFVNLHVENPVGGPLTLRDGFRELRSYVDDDAVLADRFTPDSKKDDGPPRGPPPVSTLPVTFRCSGCEQFCVRTRLTNPRDPESKWKCEDCSGEDSPYPSLR